MSCEICLAVRVGRISSCAAERPWKNAAAQRRREQRPRSGMTSARQFRSWRWRTLLPRSAAGRPAGASTPGGVSPSLAFRRSDPGTLCAVPPLSLSTGCCSERPMSRWLELAARAWLGAARFSKLRGRLHGLLDGKTLRGSRERVTGEGPAAWRVALNTKLIDEGVCDEINVRTG
jgi:hypothetical protein